MNFYVIRRDVVDNEVTGHIRRDVVDNEVTGHIRRNAVPCLRSEQGDVILHGHSHCVVTPGIPGGIVTPNVIPTTFRPPMNENRRHIEPKGKDRDVFIVRADIQSDLYILTHPQNLYDPDYAYIPNYRISVFMNSLFRRIKENQNLDAIEDSDDDEELMDTRPDKYTDLNKEYKMECMYHKKFRRWIPLRVIYGEESQPTRRPYRQSSHPPRKSYNNSRRY